jgi:hypothetical protein
MPPPDANPVQPPRPVSPSIWLGVRIGAWLVVGAWFGWFAYTRWTTPPVGRTAPGFAQRVRELPPELNRLLKAIPTPPPATMPASFPAGGFIAPGDSSFICTGAWDTTARAELARLAGHVSSPTVQPPLDELVAWLRRHTPEELGNLERPDSDPNTAFVFPTPNPVSDAESALLFRARQAAAERQDYAAAWGELRAVLRLQIAVRGSAMAYFVSESNVLFELGCLAQEAALPPELAREMIAALRDELGLSMADAAGQFQQSQTTPKPEDLLDAFYTDDGHGDGWLVLTALARTMSSDSGKPLAQRSGAWNLLSPLYHGRAQMRTRLAAWIDQMHSWDDTDYATAMAQVERRRRSADAPNVFDAAGMFMMPVVEASVDAKYETVAMRRAVVVLLALSAHKQREGAYPTSLDELVPSLLDAVPKDPITARPFEYRREGNGFRLLRPAIDDSKTPTPYYGSPFNDARFPLLEGTYQPTRDRKP